MKSAACALALWLLLSPVLAAGQGCAMCWTSANAADEAGKRTMNRAVTMLLVPTLGLMAGFVGLAVRYSRRRDTEN